ncbi:MAG: DNA-binding response regulator [Deltaproteobacteria bacterium CG_4_9_14_3_um_filter_63_12]|nr:MAG: DNA-binding response regulator [Deltaproteobacteria bacterium CG_4_9_14_3_um_filter_63_12]
MVESQHPSPSLLILLVEDDPRLADLTKRYLEKQGALVSHVTHGATALELVQRVDFDVVLLDLTLPGLDGLEVCRRLRERLDVPIIMLTARGEEADRVMGLELGADDYMPKPFSPRELLARIRALVRRARGNVGPQVNILNLGGLSIDPGAHRASVDGQALDLTSHEFKLLVALANNPGRVLSRERLMELAAGSAEESFDRSVDVHVSRLRKKLGEDPRAPRFIKTIRGVGYQFLLQDHP